MRTISAETKAKMLAGREADLRCPYCRTNGNAGPMKRHIKDCASAAGGRLPKSPPVPDLYYSNGGRNREDEARFRESLDETRLRAYYLVLFEEDGRFSWSETLRKTADILFPED